MSTAEIPAVNEAPYLDLDADLVSALNMRTVIDYELARRLLHHAASAAEENGDQVRLHPDAARLLGDRLTHEGRKKRRGPPRNRDERLFELGVLGHQRIAEVSAKNPDMPRNQVEQKVATRLISNISDLKLAISIYRRFLNEKAGLVAK